MGKRNNKSKDEAPKKRNSKSSSYYYSGGDDDRGSAPTIINSKEAPADWPTVYLTPRAYNLMSYWASLAGDKRQEFTCFGRTTADDDGLITISDAYLVKHEGTAGSVDGDDEDMVRLMMELNEKGIPPEEAFRCWVHSHPGTGPSATYLSSTDESNISRWLTGEFLVSIVFDSAGGNAFCRVDMKSPRCAYRANIQILIPELEEDVRVWAKEEFEDKASSPVYESHGAYTIEYVNGLKTFNYGKSKNQPRRSNLTDDDDDDLLMSYDWQLYTGGHHRADDDVVTAESAEPDKNAEILGKIDINDEDLSADIREMVFNYIDALAERVQKGDVSYDEAIDILVENFKMDNDEAQYELVIRDASPAFEDEEEAIEDFIL